MKPVDSVALKFLRSLGRSVEVDFYLEHFRQLPEESFAALAIDSNSATMGFESVVYDLSFLSRLGLIPLVVLGVQDTGETRAQAEHLCTVLREDHISTRLLHAFDSHVLDEIRTAIHTGVIPIVTFEDTDAPSTPGLRLAQLGVILQGLATRKMIFLRDRGGIYQKGKLIDNINLTTDSPALLTSNEVPPEERLLVVWSRRLIFELVTHKLLVTITSPIELLHELFTIKGSGTLLRRGGIIIRYDSLAGTDVERLRALLTSSFGRPVREGFFDTPFSRLYLEEGYRGVAMLIDTPLGAYLAKFAVEREAQGEGIARDLWKPIETDFSRVFWRARPQNPITGWYTKICDGVVKMAEWSVYWKGIPPGDIPQAIDFALAQPVDLVEAEGG